MKKELLYTTIYRIAFAAAILHVLSGTAHAQETTPATTQQSTEVTAANQEAIESGFIGAVRYYETNVANPAEYADWYEQGEMLGSFVIPIRDFNQSGQEYTKYEITIHMVIGKNGDVGQPTSNLIKPEFFENGQFLRQQTQEKIVRWMIGSKFDLKLEELGFDAGEVSSIVMYVTKDLGLTAVGATAMDVERADVLRMQVDRSIMDSPLAVDTTGWARLQLVAGHELAHSWVNSVEVPGTPELGLHMLTWEEAWASYQTYALSKEFDQDTDSWGISTDRFIEQHATDYFTTRFRPYLYDRNTYHFFGIFEQMRLLLNMNSRLSFITAFQTAYEELVTEGEINTDQDFPQQQVGRIIQILERMAENRNVRIPENIFYGNILTAYNAMIGSMHDSDAAYDMHKPFRAQVDALPTLTEGPYNKIRVDVPMGQRVVINIPRVAEQDTYEATFVDIVFSNPLAQDPESLLYRVANNPTTAAVPNRDGQGRILQPGDEFYIDSVRFIDVQPESYTLRLVVSKAATDGQQLILEPEIREKTLILLPAVFQLTAAAQ